MRATALALSVLLSACATLNPAPDTNAAFTAFLERAFEQQLDLDPEFRSAIGDKSAHDRWAIPTEDLFRQKHELRLRHLGELRAFDRAALSPENQVNYDVFEYRLNDQIEGERWRHHDYIVDHMYAPHSDLPAFLISRHAVDTVEDAEAFIARLRGFGAYFDATIAQVELAAAKGVRPPRFVFDKVLDTARRVPTGRPFDAGPDDNSMRAALVEKLAKLEISDEQRADLLAEADAVLLQIVAPAYQRFIAAMSKQRALAGTDDGAWKHPDGDEFYAFRLRRYTTTDLTPDEIFDLGMREVERIHGEMMALARKVGFKGTLQEFFQHVAEREDSFYPSTDAGRERYLRETVAYIDEMRERLDDLFTIKPKADLVVKRVEAFREQSVGSAFYYRGTPDGSRPGIYYVNLYDMKNMPAYEMQALAYHEGLPGHHMQGSIQQELEDLPRFRAYSWVTAYGEGWGLYSEWLPTQIGMYTDPYQDYGRLSMELWRACRLVLDAGIHHKRWTREQSVQWMLETTANAESEIRIAVDRYIVWPGHSSAYMVGNLKIRELRARAEKALGEKFDVRLFHDEVLRHGAVPLAILEQLIDRWISSQR